MRTEYLRTSNFEDYQREAAIKTINAKRLAILLKPGYGKTAIALKALSHWKKQHHKKGKRMKTLIVAPIYVCESVWRDEAAQWIFSRNIQFTLLRGSPTVRERRLKYETDVFLINYELLTWLVPLVEKKKIQFDCVIFDELSKLANVTTKVHKAACYFKDVRYKIGLTGTPVGNNLINLFGEMFCIDGGKTLGDNFYSFRFNYFQPASWNPYQWEPYPTTKRLIFRAIRDSCFSYVAKNKPKPKFINLSCYLGNSANSLIQSVKRDKVLADMVLRGADVHNKISQIESGFYIYVDDFGKKTIVDLHNTKLERVNDLIEELEGESLLVFYRYVADLRRLQSIGFSSKNTPRFISKWNNGEIKKLALHPSSVGHGLNLQRGGSNILFYGLPWSVELFEQSIGRLLRTGQKNQVCVYWFGTEQEQVIFEALIKRHKVENALKKYLSRD